MNRLHGRVFRLWKLKEIWMDFQEEEKYSFVVIYKTWTVGGSSLATTVWQFILCCPFEVTYVMGVFHLLTV